MGVCTVYRTRLMSNIALNSAAFVLSQKPELGYDKLLLSFDQGFSAYLEAIGRRTDWRW
jgi:hypothetical protein